MARWSRCARRHAAQDGLPDTELVGRYRLVHDPTAVLMGYRVRVSDDGSVVGLWRR